MPPYGACLLGSFNLAAYVYDDNHCYQIDYYKLQADIPHIIRAMDNIVDVADYPLPEQEDEAKSKRRMGIGVTGVANAIEACGNEYGTHDFTLVLSSLLEVIRDYSYSASIELAKEKGSFPLFDKDKYTQGKFIKTLPREIQEGIAQHGIRNSHLLSIAPTGTISMCANNVSSGIEPVLYYEADRTIQTFDGPTTVPVVDYGWSHFGVRGRLAKDCSISDHLNVQATAQQYVDSAVSKTINFYPSRGGADFYREEFKPVYMRAYELGLKGITTFNHNGKRAGLFKESDTEGEGMMCGLGGQECGA